MKTMRAKALFTSMLLSAAVPSMLFSAEEQPRQPSLSSSERSKVIEHSVTKSSLAPPAFMIFEESKIRTQWVAQTPINELDQYGDTKLKHAVFRCNPEAVKKLLKDNADINGMDLDGYTVLGLAAFLGDFTMAKLLLKNNADPRFKANGIKRTPIQIAKKKGHKKMAVLLCVSSKKSRAR